jgi:hypothetical protein
VATLHRVCKAPDVDRFEEVLGQWAHAALGDCLPPIAEGGKALRGIHGEQLPGVRFVAAYDVQTGLVVAQRGVRQHSTALLPDATGELEERAEEKSQAELSLGHALLRRIPVRGRVVTGDAL